MNKSQIRFAMAAHAAWLLMNRFAVDGRSLRFEIRFIAQVSGTSGAPRAS